MLKSFMQKTMNQGIYITILIILSMLMTYPSSRISVPFNSAYNKSSNIKHWIVRALPKASCILFAKRQVIDFLETKETGILKRILSLLLSLLGEFKPNILISTSGPIENHSFCLKFKKYITSLTGLVSIETHGRTIQCSQKQTHQTLTSRMLRLKERFYVKDMDLVLAVSPMIQEYYHKIL